MVWAKWWSIEPPARSNSERWTTNSTRWATKVSPKTHWPTVAIQPVIHLQFRGRLIEDPVLVGARRPAHRQAGAGEGNRRHCARRAAQKSPASTARWARVIRLHCGFHMLLDRFLLLTTGFARGFVKWAPRSSRI
jgi:hypothetical protein